jgi:hypothetical protein
MRNKAFDLAQWSFSSSDRILPDANFWINVFGPSAVVGQRNSRAAAYSQAFGQMLQNNVEILLDVLVLSEFVNTLTRLEFNANFSSTYGSRGFKKFRNSPDFIPVSRMIARECRKIVRRSQRTDHPFSEWNIEDTLTTFEQGGEDFNDQLITLVAKKRNCILLTDDGDMTDGRIDVLTANPRLLRACPSS